LTAPAVEQRMNIVPSGQQFEINSGEQRATIVEVGGGIREYVVAGRPVLDPYPRESMCDGAHGAPLIPWPNRLADGRYRFDEVEYQVALSEPERHNAIHGLLRWRPWSASEHASNRVVMRTQLHPLTGYPFALDLRIAYELSDAGLEVSTTATNNGQRPCPYGAGQHPYLSPGRDLIDDCTLQLPAQTRIVTDEARKVPIGSEPVDCTQFDFRSARLLGAERLDVAFTDLARDDSGSAVTRFTCADGGCVELWVDEHYKFLEVYTGDELSPSRRRRGLAVEPMTCAPNAFQSGQGLLRLEPGQSITTRWGAALARPRDG
jgi:aldose 1-epimerase